MENKDARALGSRRSNLCLRMSSWGTFTLPSKKRGSWEKDGRHLGSANTREGLCTLVGYRMVIARKNSEVHSISNDN